MLQEKGDRALNLFINISLVILGLLILYPLWYVVICSFSDPDDIVQGKVFFWISNFTLLGYEEMFTYTDLWLGYKNSIIYTGVATVLGVILQLTAAYALARKGMPGRRLINLFFMFTMYFSGGTIPGYMLINDLGWVNTPWVMMFGGLVSVWNLIVARSFFMSSIPESLFDAARIDGCGYFRFFVKVVVPLSTAMIAIIALYNMQSHWNAYMTGVIYLQDKKYFSLQQIIAIIQGAVQESSVENPTASQLEEIRQKEIRAQLLRYTTVIVAALPMIIAYPFVQKYFVKGVMVGSVKG